MNVLTYDALLIRGGRIIDPYTGRDEIADVAVERGVIARHAAKSSAVLDATGLIVCPGLMDIHVHLREPGQTNKETIATGTVAAAAGGFTYVACMPNTRPPLDNADSIRYVLEHAQATGYGTVGPVAAITRGRSGREVTDFASLKAAGAVAFSDDGDGVEDDAVMRAAFIRAKAIDAVLIQHCEYKAISTGGVMHLGDVSRRIGLPGLDPRSEEAMIERDIDLCRETGGRYHVAHISTARSVELVRRAKTEGLPVTAEVCPHHLLLTDEACAAMDPNTKMHPPLRTAADVAACLRGLLDGTIDCIVSDHAPHTTEEKSRGFLKAPPGIVGLETALGLSAKALIEPKLAAWPRVIGWLTSGPSRVLGLPQSPIEPGGAANLTLIDPAAKWIVDPGCFKSLGRNTPFSGWELRGRAAGVIVDRRAIGVSALLDVA